MTKNQWDLYSTLNNTRDIFKPKVLISINRIQKMNREELRDAIIDYLRRTTDIH